MKRTASTFLILIFTCLGFSAKAQHFAKLEKSAIIAFNESVMDYGTIAQGSNGTRTFTFVNKGNAPLIISEVKTSCGCTVPSYSKTPILPGQEGTLQINYDTKRLGSFSKTITVISNAKTIKNILKIKGEVVTAN